MDLPLLVAGFFEEELQRRSEKHRPAANHRLLDGRCRQRRRRLAIVFYDQARCQRESRAQDDNVDLRSGSRAGGLCGKSF